jgi:hypothetical protein
VNHYLLNLIGLWVLFDLIVLAWVLLPMVRTQWRKAGRRK